MNSAPDRFSNSEIIKSFFKPSVLVRIFHADDIFDLKLGPGVYKFGSGEDVDYILPVRAANEDFTLHVNSLSRVRFSHPSSPLAAKNPNVKFDAWRKRHVLKFSNGFVRVGRKRKGYPVAALLGVLVLISSLETNDRLVAAAIPSQSAQIIRDLRTSKSDHGVSARDMKKNTYNRKLLGLGLPYQVEISSDGQLTVTGQGNGKTRAIAETLLNSSEGAGASVKFADQPLLSPGKGGGLVAEDAPAMAAVKVVQVMPTPMIIFSDNRTAVVGSVDSNGWAISEISLDVVTFTKAGKRVVRKF